MALRSCFQVPAEVEVPAESFCEAALSLGLLTEEAQAELLRRHQEYRLIGIPLGVEEVALEHGLLSSLTAKQVLREVARRDEVESASEEDWPAGRFEGLESTALPAAFAQFTLHQRLGRSSSLVFRAYDNRCNRWVVVKLMARSSRSDPQRWARFQREMAAVRRLKHPNLIRFLAGGVEDGQPYLVTEYIAGENLAQRIQRRGWLEEAEALRFASEIARALACLHGLGLVHRDLKPENVIVDKYGQTRVVDLGLAKHYSARQAVTVDGVILGSPDYMAPEQVLALPQIGPPADLYALGITLYQMLCGTCPYTGRLHEVLRKHVEEPLPDPRRLRPAISLFSRRLIQHCTQKDPQQRPAGAEEIASAIDLHLELFFSGALGRRASGAEI